MFLKLVEWSTWDDELSLLPLPHLRRGLWATMNSFGKRWEGRLPSAPQRRSRYGTGMTPNPRSFLHWHSSFLLDNRTHPCSDGIRQLWSSHSPMVDLYCLTALLTTSCDHLSQFWTMRPTGQSAGGLLEKIISSNKNRYGKRLPSFPSSEWCCGKTYF